MNLDQIRVTKATNLAFGEGLIGRDYTMEGLTEARFARNLASHMKELWKPNTADCIDARRTVRLAQTEDGLILVERVVPQLPGGEGLAATKAAVAAAAKIVSDAKTMWDAYIKISNFLADNGEEDAAHVGCGASTSVEASVRRRIDSDLLMPAIGLFVTPNERTTSLVQANLRTKENRLQDGFYGDWEPLKHLDYVSNKFPQNFSYLEVDYADHETYGHRERSLYVVTSENMGFAKDAFSEETNEQAFSVTLPKMRQLAHMLGGSDEERERILLGFIDDTLHVSNGLVAKGMTVFAEAA